LPVGKWLGKAKPCPVGEWGSWGEEAIIQRTSGYIVQDITLNAQVATFHGADPIAQGVTALGQAIGFEDMDDVPRRRAGDRGEAFFAFLPCMTSRACRGSVIVRKGILERIQKSLSLRIAQMDAG
jgi:hypothetical protein